MVDAADLKSVASNGVRVQVPPRALSCNSLQMGDRLGKQRVLGFFSFSN